MWTVLQYTLTGDETIECTDEELIELIAKGKVKDDNPIWHAKHTGGEWVYAKDLPVFHKLKHEARQKLHQTYRERAELAQAMSNFREEERQERRAQREERRKAIFASIGEWFDSESFGCAIVLLAHLPIPLVILLMVIHTILDALGAEGAAEIVGKGVDVTIFVGMPIVMMFWHLFVLVVVVLAAHQIIGDGRGLRLGISEKVVSILLLAGAAISVMGGLVVNFSNVYGWDDWGVMAVIGGGVLCFLAIKLN